MVDLKRLAHTEGASVYMYEEWHYPNSIKDNDNKQCHSRVTVTSESRIRITSISRNGDGMRM